MQIVMKNTARTHQKNKHQIPALQGEKPSIPGQNVAAAGHHPLENDDGVVDHLECVITKAEAMFGLMFLSLESRNVDIFHIDNGHLLAGLQDLLKDLKNDLWLAHEHAQRLCSKINQKAQL